MIRMLILTVSLLLSIPAMAQPSLLDDMAGQLRNNAAVMQYDYTLSLSGVKTVGTGTLIAQDNVYSMDGNGLKIKCDGTSVYVMDSEAKEVVVEGLSEGPDVYLSNPVLLLTQMNDIFDVSSASTNAGGCVYSLKPRTDCGIVSGSVQMNLSEGRPVLSLGEFVLSGGERLDIKIKSMTYIQKKPLTFYAFDLSGLDSSWIVTDLR